MTTAVVDPLIDGMTIRRMLPLHESSGRLRRLTPDSPRVHGVAVMADVSRRRWWPLDSVTTTDRLADMFEASVDELGDRRAVGQQLAATFTHAVLGRVVTLFVLEGRAWDAGPGNLWMHVDSEGTIDWAAVVDPMLRVLPDDPAMADVVRLPNEVALATWTAHRCHRSLEPIFECLNQLSRGALTPAAMWQMVGSAVVITATQVPQLAGTGELTCMRRGQLVLDALIGFGLPVRALRRTG
ncbi:iron reductase [Mycobacterium sp. CVI_P3]|uniref:Iron reductase n=1 Tax=Mycobacterium pinniadriaticum TaxID=2994102 RepID=A0ABT3S9A1_9MYCO|nr:iron reductase [Mycobacterium pinniadriaticum]MCX2929659.1 iron reductase [Mycobacterium pinniadriaticum]MCX2936083.1 iron reductase [Mycobacterium pinniadriaticum]